MPSKSYIDFLELLEDVKQLTAAHNIFNSGTAGRKKLGFLTRSAIVMLCAAWERYNENLLLEAITQILNTSIEAKNLPKEIKKYINDKVKENKNETYAIELADNGWKNLWMGYAINETDFLNTPNSENLNLLYRRFLGMPTYTYLWAKNSVNQINLFIKLRGEIAHNGSKAKYVRFISLVKTIDLIAENVQEIDNNMSIFLKGYTVSPPWNDTYYRSLESYRK